MILSENLDPPTFAKWSRTCAIAGNFARRTWSGVPASAARGTPRPVGSTVGMRAKGAAPAGWDCGRTNIVLGERIADENELGGEVLQGTQRRSRRS